MERQAKKIRVEKLEYFIGAHVSAANGVQNSVLNASRIGARSFALFVKNQRRWESAPLSKNSIVKFREFLEIHNFRHSQILPHGSYLINLGNPDSEKRVKSYEAFIDELARCHELGIPLYNMHPGSTVGKCSVKDSIELIATCINKAHQEVSNVCVVLETMAGQGNTIGNSFEDLRGIIDLVADKSRIGVCIDTCHIFSAGYDIRTRECYDETMKKFDDIIGFEFLRGVHLNDSKCDFASCKDRHENLGKGKIGIEAFKFILNDDRFRGIPLVLETPVDKDSNEVDSYTEEIKLLTNLLKDRQGDQ